MWDLPSHLIGVIVIAYSFHRHKISFQNLSISIYLYLTTFHQMESAKIEFLIIIWLFLLLPECIQVIRTIQVWQWLQQLTSHAHCAHVSCSLSACTSEQLPVFPRKTVGSQRYPRVLPEPWPTWIRRGLVAFPRFTLGTHLALAGV